MYALHAQQNTPSHRNETWSDWKGRKVRRRCQGTSHKSENHTKTDSFLSGGWSDEGLVVTLGTGVRSDLGSLSARVVISALVYIRKT